MRLLFWILCSTLLANPLQAAIKRRPQPVVLPACFSSGRLGFDFEIMSWRPSGTRELLAISGTTIDDHSIGTVYFPTTAFKVGYRVGGWYQFCQPQSYIGAWVAWQTSRHTETKLPLPDGGMRGIGGGLTQLVSQAEGNLKVRYIAADLEFGQCLVACYGLSAYLFAGARYVDINLAARFSYIPVIPVITDELIVFDLANPRFHGVGPRIGLGANRLFCRYWTVRFKLGVSMLFATRSISGHEVIAEDGGAIDFTVSNLNYSTWSMDGRLGLELCIAVSPRTVVQLEGGWSADYIADSLKEATDGGGTSPSFGFRPFNIGGPYGRIAYTF